MQLISVFILLVLVLEIAADCKLGKRNVSKLKHPIERVFSRKKRFLTFPAGTTFKITVALGKSVSGNVPRGLNLSIELNFYYPIPGPLEEWLPLKKKPPAPPKPLVDIYIPGTPIFYKAIPVAKPVVYIKKADTDPITWINKHPQQPYSSWKSKLNTPPKTGNTNGYIQWPNYRGVNKYPWTSYQPSNVIGNEINRKVVNYHPAHRERRDLYSHFEGLSSVLGFDMKSCILRTICESKRFLLPPGHSLIQDILRILFSIPKTNGEIDEYSRAMGGDYSDCRNVYTTKCPISFLNFMTNSKNKK